MIPSVWYPPLLMLFGCLGALLIGVITAYLSDRKEGE